MMLAGLIVIAATGILACLFFIFIEREVTGWATHTQDMMMTGG